MEDKYALRDKLMMGGSVLSIGTLGYLATRYHVCNPEEFLVRTGLGIKDMIVSKKGIQFPFQNAIKISMNPITYNFDLHNMSKEKIEFRLPVSFTISPINPIKNMEGFIRYSTMMHDMSSSEIEKTILGIVEGGIRCLTGALTVEELFNSKDAFKTHVIDKVREELDKMGLEIHNANIREMGDFDAKNKYFEYRKQRGIETANYEAQVDVQNAKTHGESKMAELNTISRRNVAEAEKEAKLAENMRKIDIANSNALLREAEAEGVRRSNIADTNAKMEVQKRELELQREIEERRMAQEIIAKRADLVSKAMAEAEAKRLIAEAELYQEQKRAEGIFAKYKAESDGIKEMLSSAGENTDFAKFYIASNKQLFEKLANASADAFKGLNPKINILSSSDKDSNVMAPLIKTAYSLVPLIEGLREQLEWKPSSLQNKPHLEDKRPSK